MSDVQKLEPVTRLKINDIDYELRPTFRALSAIEEALGSGLLTIISRCVTGAINQVPNFTLLELRAILSSGATPAIPPQDLENYLVESIPSRVEATAKAVEFLLSSFRKSDYSDSSDGEDKKK